MDIYLYSKRTDLAATTLADLNLLIAALADELDADNQATIARVTGKLETMVQADSGVPLAVYSYDDAAGTVSSWVTNAAVTVSIGLGDPDPQSGDTYASTGTTAITGSSRTATLALNTGELANALGYGTTPRRPARTFYLHIRKTESSVTKTVGLLAVEVAAGVLSTPIASLLNTPDIGAARFSTLTHVNGAVISDPGSGGLAITASGTDQDITLTPSGTGATVLSSNYGSLPSGITGANERTQISTVAAINAPGFAPTLRGRRMNNTFASPSDVVSGNTLFAFEATGRRGGAWSNATNSAWFKFLASENWSSATNGGTRFAVSTIANGTVGVVEGFSVENDGAVVFSLSATPASATAAGVAGTIAWDASYIYCCVATNTWKRTAIATW
jgi:hypothetical protein